MTKKNNLPKAISHKELTAFLSKAKKKDSNEEIDFDSPRQEIETFNKLINDWTSMSEMLLTAIEKDSDQVLKEANKTSVMALGALGAHLRMALQAKRAYEHE